MLAIANLARLARPIIMTEGVDFWPRGAYILSMKNEAQPSEITFGSLDLADSVMRRAGAFSSGGWTHKGGTTYEFYDSALLSRVRSRMAEGGRELSNCGGLADTCDGCADCR